MNISNYLGFRETPANFREICGEKRPVSLKFQQQSGKVCKMQRNSAKWCENLQNFAKLLR